MVDFDPDKDAVNRAKHGVSLDQAEQMNLAAAVIVVDDRYDYGEVRYRAFGLINGVAHCLIFTVRPTAVRAISLRRAHAKEMERYGL